MKPARIVAIVVCVAILAVFAGIMGQRIYRYSAIKDKLQEAVGQDTGYTETLLKVESEGSHMTFGELFELCDRSIEGRTNLIIELRGLYPSINLKLKEDLIGYLNAENEFARSKRDFYRKQMQLSGAFDLYKETVLDIPTSYYGGDFYQSNTARRKRETNDAALEMQSSAASFLESYSKCSAQRMAWRELRIAQVCGSFLCSRNMSKEIGARRQMLSRSQVLSSSRACRIGDSIPRYAPSSLKPEQSPALRCDAALLFSARRPE